MLQHQGSIFFILVSIEKFEVKLLIPQNALVSLRVQYFYDYIPIFLAIMDSYLHCNLSGHSNTGIITVYVHYNPNIIHYLSHNGHQ